MRLIATPVVMLAVAFAVSAQTPPAPAVGSLCILPHIKLADVYMGSPDMPPPAEKYTLQLDGGQWVALSTQKRVFLTNIPRAGRHKVAIRGDGHPWAAFSFAFDRSPSLCLYQNDMYLWWQLFAVKDSFKSCACTDVEPSAWKPVPPK